MSDCKPDTVTVNRNDHEFDFNTRFGYDRTCCHATAVVEDVTAVTFT